MKVTVDLAPWTDDPICPKCLRGVDTDELFTAAFNYMFVDEENILVITCRSCGYTYLSESADAKD